MINLNTNKIIIPVDFSLVGVRAISHGAFLAKLTKGELILLHVQKKAELLDLIIPALKLKDVSVITDYIESKLKDMAEGIRKEYGIIVTPATSTGNVTSAIVKMTKKLKAGMIIMGTQGGDSGNDLFLGSNSYRLLTKSSVPVMTVRTISPKLGYKNIVLPIDLSEHSRQKVNIAIQLAAKFGAHLHLLGLLSKNDTEHKFKLEVILPQIEKLAKAKKIVCTADIKVTPNKAKATLTYAKSKKADLIVTMSDQDAEFSRFILGSYAHQLINDSLIPVLSIPPEIHNENLATDSIGGLW
jgi:nucleotide-binding universal stress UspA family protein